MGPIGLGHAQQGADHPRRQDRREVLHVVERARSHVGVEQLGADGAHVVLERTHPAWRERPRHQGPNLGVVGRVEQDQHGVAAPRLRGHQLEHDPVVRAEALRVAARRLHVLVAAQRVEVVLLVVVDGRLVAQASPHVVGLGVDGGVVGIPVQVGHDSSALLRGADDGADGGCAEPGLARLVPVEVRPVRVWRRTARPNGGTR